MSGIKKISRSSMENFKKDLTKLREELTQLELEMNITKKRINDLKEKARKASTCNSTKCKSRGAAYKRKLLEEQEESEMKFREMESLLKELEISCAMMDRLYP